MTFFSTTCSFGTFPFWLWMLGKNHIDFKKIIFPWWSMLLSLLTLFIPALTGFLLRRYRPVLAHRIGRYLNPIAVGTYNPCLTTKRSNQDASLSLGYLVFILTFGGTSLGMSSLMSHRSFFQFISICTYFISLISKQSWPVVFSPGSASLVAPSCP